VLLIGLFAAFSASASLTHRWSFTETNGPIVDSKGTANGQVVLFGANDVVRSNGFVRLTGGTRATAGYVQLPAGLLEGLSNVTVEAWIRPVSFQNWSRAFDFGSGSNTANTFFLSLCRGTSGNLQRLEFLPTTLDTGVASTAGTQYHYVVTWSATAGSTGGGRFEWFRNGVSAGAMDTGATTISNVDDTVLWLGRSQYGADNTANAEYAEVRMYSHVLSQAQINTNFANGPDVLVLLQPVAVNDAITLNPGAKALLNVLQNDQPLGAPLDPATVTVVNPPSAGTAVVESDGKILYTHNGGLAIADQFGYTVKDTAGSTSQVATVSITVSNAFRLPNTTITIPNTPPQVGYQVVDAFPGLTFEDAVAVRSMPGNTNRLFVCERRGIISYVPDITATNPVRLVFLDIRDQVQFDNTGEGESGLLSMEFHPGFATNGIFFVDYVAPITKYPAAGWATNSYDRVSRFVANPTTLAVDTNTQQILINVKDDGDVCNCVNNHNAGDLHFGPIDGYLYISFGDEGSQYNARQNSQRIDKDFYSGILRIDVDKRPGNIEPKAHTAIPTNGNGQAFYSIPLDNPFVGATNFFGASINTNTLRAEFFAVGLRHPWRFSIDTNGEVWAGDVGQDRYEEVDIVQRGSNYGWAYFEGVHLAFPMYNQPTLLTNPPPGLADPLYEFPHTSVAGGDPQFKGNSISGGVVYHGARIPDLANSYVFGDFESANLWALWRTNGTVLVQRIAGDSGMAAFGTDPNNGDVLIANYLENKVKRLIRVDAANTTFPTKLSDTGVFADLATLTPNPGIVNYDPIVAFWSDYAIKRRWFVISNLSDKITFATDTNWTFPSGMKWIKHFDLETERGNPATKKRIETRVLVKTDTGTYGVSYKWNDTQTDAFLVADGGTNFFVTVVDGVVTNQQQWEIPSRAACIVCHTPIAGHALSFNTRELNQSATMNGVTDNQIATLNQAGYFSAPVANIHTLPAYVTAVNSNASLEYRVRSYLAVNCVQCHQAGGAGAPSWDARPYLTLAQTHLINGVLENSGGNPTNKLVVPGDVVHSVLLKRIAGDGFSRMPPLATHQLDQGSIALLTSWISSDTNRQDFAQWQTNHFGSSSNPNAAVDADPDGDRGRNYFEFLTGTDPQNPLSLWKLSATVSAGQVNISYPQVPNLGVVIETSSDLRNWAPWDVAGNQPFFSATAGTVVLHGPLSNIQFFRARLVEP
jgi:glucose/arabinose dehydrogenase/mono/diheme cytochrome c family protein